MEKREPNGAWLPSDCLPTLDGFSLHWKPKDKAAPCFVIQRNGGNRYWHNYYVTRYTSRGYEILQCSSKTAALKTARDLNRTGRIAAGALRAMKKRGYSPGDDIAMYDNAFWRVIGGGSERATCQFLFALDGHDRNRTTTSMIRWGNLTKFSLVQLGQLYMELGTFIRAQGQRFAGEG